MLQRIYIDNYRCFSNFEWRPPSRALIVGRNGSGKSSFFDFLSELVSFISAGSQAPSLFGTNSLCCWDQRNVQRFEIDANNDNGLFEYKLRLQHDRQLQTRQIEHESLMFEQKLIYEFSEGKVSLKGRSSDASFPAVADRSQISTIPDVAEFAELTAFRRIGLMFAVVAPDPKQMNPYSKSEEFFIYRNMSNLVSWLRHLQAEDSTLSSELQRSLEPLLPGFVNYSLKGMGDQQRKMFFNFKSNGNGSEYLVGFDQLSDGQRVLTALHTLLHGAIRSGNILCIDEPENFIAIREMQPWLLALHDKQEETGCQCFIASHHPEFINYLTPLGETFMFSREDGGPVRISKYSLPPDETLTPAELMARGWEV